MCKACPSTPDDSRPIAADLHVGGLVRPWGQAIDMSDYIITYDGYQQSDRTRVGGKNAGLCEMIGAGLPVPPGFAVTTEAYDTLREHPDLARAVNTALSEVDYADPLGLAKISDRVRGLIEAVPIDPQVEIEVRHAYEQLCDMCGVPDVAVAVRSSATAEDLPDASFAGQQDTFLWVTGDDAVIESMRRCWSSIFTDRAISYRHQMGHDHEQISMAVGVQKMVHPKAAGVAFTLNPTDGDRSQIAIDSSWGFGEAVVSGEVTPDHFLVDKVILEIVKRTISPKAIEYRLTGANTVEKVEVAADRQSQASLQDSEIKAVATIAKRAERFYGSPQDVEWAIDLDLPDGENVVLLQTRPETVWSRKKRKTVATGQGGLADIVATLISPMHRKSTVGTTAKDTDNGGDDT